MYIITFVGIDNNAMCVECRLGDDKENLRAITVQCFNFIDGKSPVELISYNERIAKFKVLMNCTPEYQGQKDYKLEFGDIIEVDSNGKVKKVRK